MIFLATNSVIGSCRSASRSTRSLEDEFWNALKQIAITQKIPLRELVLKIDNERADSGLSSAIRVYVRNYHSDKRSAKT
jgi:predicted DNA-binding ribbon-helix-helix protein